MRRADPEDQAKLAIARYYERMGVMPTVQLFAREMGYSSVSGAHHTLSKLVRNGYLARDEAGGKLLPGPAFDWAQVRRPADSGIPRLLRDVLPEGVELRVEEVTDAFEADDSIWPGDLLVLAPASRTDLSDLMVLNRGKRFVFANEPRLGWTLHGIVVGQFRSHAK